MKKSNLKTKCQVEALEDRQLPAVTLSLLNQGTTLSIKGDSSPESVHLFENDESDQLAVSWRQITGGNQVDFIPVSMYQSSAIKKIVIDLGAGDDALTYQLDGQSMKWEKSISVNLGSGQDSAFIDLGGSLIVPLYTQSGLVVEGGSGTPIDFPQPQPSELLANLAVHVQGGVGDDSIEAIFGNIRKGLTYSASGGIGDDSLNTQVAGNISANVIASLNQDGGAGNDQLRVHLGSRGIDAGGKGAVSQSGGAGNDFLLINNSMRVNGALVLNQSGGLGGDMIKSHSRLDWPSTGTVSARVYGDAGNDQIELRIKRDDIPPNVALLLPLRNMRVDAVVNGGLGRNVGWVTPNVRSVLTQLKNKSWDMDQGIPLG